MLLKTIPPKDKEGTPWGATLFGGAADHAVWPCRFASPDYSGFAFS
jgi:hypothetical protein